MGDPRGYEALMKLQPQARPMENDVTPTEIFRVTGATLAQAAEAMGLSEKKNPFNSFRVLLSRFGREVSKTVSVPYKKNLFPNL